MENPFRQSLQNHHDVPDGEESTGLLSVVLDRLYVLRNQLMHGGATWNSQVNRQQVKDVQHHDDLDARHH